MKKISGRIVAVLAVTALILSGIHALNYILVDDSTSFTRLMMHEFYNQDNIDILCLGASHCFRGVIPSVVSEKTGKKVFDASSSLQEPDASYALLKEAIELYDIEEVYMEVSSSIACRSIDYSKRKNLTNVYLVSDYMRPLLNKLQLLLGASASRYYVNSFLPFRRYWNSILDFQYINSILEKKSSDIYRNYEYDYAKNERAWYVGDGYVAYSKVVEDHKFNKAIGYKHDIIDTEKISDDWKNNILSIIDYCNKHNVKITLYDTPISYYQLCVHGNYDTYINFVRDLIKGRDVEYVEFNLLKDEYFPYKQTNYMDGHHLNMYGAQDFSEFFADYLNGNIPDSAYYESVSEKLSDLAPDYYGIAFKKNKNTNIRTIRLISNAADYYEYKVEITKNDGDTHLLQDFDTNDELSFSQDMLAADANGFAPKLVVTYRPAGSDDAGTRIEY